MRLCKSHEKYSWEYPTNSMNYQLTMFKQSPSSKKKKRQHLGSIEEPDSQVCLSLLQCNRVNKPRGRSTKTTHAFNLYWFPLSVWGVVIYNCLILFTVIGKNFKGGSLEFNIRLRKSPNNIDFSWVLQEPRYLLWSSCFTGHNAGI